MTPLVAESRELISVLFFILWNRLMLAGLVTRVIGCPRSCTGCGISTCVLISDAVSSETIVEDASDGVCDGVGIDGESAYP